MSGLGFFNEIMEVHPLLIALIIIITVFEIVWLIKKGERKCYIIYSTLVSIVFGYSLCILTVSKNDTLSSSLVLAIILELPIIFKKKIKWFNN